MYYYLKALEYELQLCIKHAFSSLTVSTCFEQSSACFYSNVGTTLMVLGYSLNLTVLIIIIFAAAVIENENSNL